MPLLLLPLPEQPEPPPCDETPPHRLKRNRSSHRALYRLVVGEAHSTDSLPVSSCDDARGRKRVMGMSVSQSGSGIVTHFGEIGYVLSSLRDLLYSTSIGAERCISDLYDLYDISVPCCRPAQHLVTAG